MKKMSADRLIFNVVGYIFIILLAAACVLPFLMVISGSLTAEDSIIQNGYSLIPDDFSLDAYRLALKAPEKILRAYGVTTFVTVVGTFCGLLITSMTAYVLQRKDFAWRNKFAYFFFFTTLFSGGLVPWYVLMVKYLHLKNSLLAVILPGMLSVFNILIMRNFMSGVDGALIDAAKIDGAGEFRIYFNIMLPLAKPALATIGLFMALAYWNEWYNTMLFITDEDLYSLQYYLYQILNSVNARKNLINVTGIVLPTLPEESLKLAMTVIATGPIVLLYPFVQRYFVKGITVGAVKG